MARGFRMGGVGGGSGTPTIFEEFIDGCAKITSMINFHQQYYTSNPNSALTKDSNKITISCSSAASGNARVTVVALPAPIDVTGRSYYNITINQPKAISGLTEITSGVADSLSNGFTATYEQSRVSNPSARTFTLSRAISGLTGDKYIFISIYAEQPFTFEVTDITLV